MNADPHRNQPGRRWVSKAVVYTLASTAAALIAGALLGLVGSALPLTVRLAGASLLAVAAVIIGGLELTTRRLRLPQRDCETPQRWLRAGPIGWAVANGAALGVGATSRIGFWLWYVVPLGALLTGEPLAGAVLYGVYGLVRGWAVWLWLIPLPVRVPGDDLSLWLLTRFEVARRLTAGQLLVVGSAVVVAVGL